ncbi:MAG: HK97 gp10 family phage protein [Methanobrevibacter sp.]|nr:HK97 gp10 family phage protein [Methanobrevibacter sp.]
MEITIDIDRSQIGNLHNITKKTEAKALSYIAQDMLRFLQRNSPVDHGRLKAWAITSLTDEEAHIKSPAEYAAAQNYGSTHMIKPKNKKALHWITGYSASYASGHVSANGAFSKGHMITIKPKHFVERSFKDLEPRIPGHFLKALEESG